MDKKCAQLKYFFQTELKGDIERLGAEKRKGMVFFKISVFFSLLLVFIIMFSLVISPLKLNAVRMGLGSSGGIVLMLAILFFFIFNNSFRSYQKTFKRVIIPEIIRYLNDGVENLNFQPDGFIPVSFFAGSQLFNVTPHHYSGIDLVSGKLGSIQISCSKVLGSAIEGSPFSSKSKSFFDGLFFVADFNKSFSSKIMVQPNCPNDNFSGKRIDHLNSDDRYFHKKKFIRVENSEFEKRFTVYGDDPVESRHLLSPRLIKKMINFQKRTHHLIYLSFLDSKLYVAISFKKKLFRHKPITHITLNEVIETYFENLKITFDILDELQMNTKIWRKSSL